MRAEIWESFDSSEDLLEAIAADVDAGSGSDLLYGFLARTPSLTAGEQAELLGGFLETPARTPPSRSPTPSTGARPSTTTSRSAAVGSRSRPAPSSTARTTSSSSSGTSSRRGGVTLDQVMGGAQQGLDWFSRGAGVISQFASMFGGNDPRARDVARVAGQLSQGSSAVGGMIGGLRGGAVPSLPGPAPTPPTPAPSAPAPTSPTDPTAGAGGASPPPDGSVAPPPDGGTTGPTPTTTSPTTAPTPSPTGAGTAGRQDATAMLALLLSNPQLQQALRASPVLGRAGSRSVRLAVPSAQGQQQVSIPLGAVMNLVASLAGRSMAELNATTREDDPEVPAYLVDDRGEWLVDPAEPDDRAALVLQYFRAADEAERFGESTTFGEDDEGAHAAAYEDDEAAYEDDEAAHESGEAAYEAAYEDGEAAYEAAYEADDDGGIEDNEAAYGDFEAAAQDDGGADFEGDATGFDDGFDGEDDEADFGGTEADDENDEHDMDESDRWLMEAGFDDWGNR